MWLTGALVAAPATRGTAQATAPTATAPATLRVAPLFADGMVLQRRQPIVVWGWAPAATPISVTLRVGSATSGSARRASAARADSSGRWRVTLPAVEAGGPYTLLVSTPQTRASFRDVLVGDVWLASGQSNMEFTVARERNAAREIANARDARIREFKIPTGFAYHPQDSLAGGRWSAADAAHVGEMSAVGYFFARALRKSTGVPIGIVNSTWGGSNIETWLSRSALSIDDAAWQQIVSRQARIRDSVQASLQRTLGSLPTVDAGLVNGRALWADPALDDRAWASVPVPGYWEGAGFGGLDGIGWYRVPFTLTDAEIAAGVALTMDALDDDDITWVNGQEIGRTSGYNVPRRYPLPATVLRAGRNVLTVRVSDYAGGGGINGPVSLVIGSAPRAITRSLAGTWSFKVGVVSFQPDGQVINKIPSVLYNQMMHPLVPFPVAGVIWYQGESNANNDEQAIAYRPLFRTLVESWRAERNAPTLPVLWVQLPNYGKPDATPPRTAGWALLREATEAALALPRTGQAITIDIGEADDIHPRNKIDVGERLALVARRVAYGERIESSGPTYRSHVTRGDTIVVQFDHLAAGLRAGNGTVRGFAIAGADQRWAWADARIVGNTVRVWSSTVRSPVAVRYAWGNSPSGLTLTNSLGLPAAPFRTDRW